MPRHPVQLQPREIARKPTLSKEARVDVGHARAAGASQEVSCGFSEGIQLARPVTARGPCATVSPRPTPGGDGLIERVRPRTARCGDALSGLPAMWAFPFVRPCFLPSVPANPPISRAPWMRMVFRIRGLYYCWSCDHTMLIRPPAVDAQDTVSGEVRAPGKSLAAVNAA